MGARERVEGGLELVSPHPEFKCKSCKLTFWAHDAPLLHLSFAHPLHGSLLASCSHDRTVRIWEEPSSASSSSSGMAPRDGRWVEKGVLTGAKGSVRNVEFAPPSPSFGLRVVCWLRVSSTLEGKTKWQASISTDSTLRIHTSLDPALSDWSLSNSVHIPTLRSPGNRDDPQATEQTTTAELATGGWGLSWCKERWWGSVLAVFAGTNPTVKVSPISLDPEWQAHQADTARY